MPDNNDLFQDLKKIIKNNNIKQFKIKNKYL